QASMKLLAELQRRKVFKVAGAYAVVGWLLIQVAATIGPQLNLPEWAPRLITFLILLGFPIALVVAWVFDVTPGGVKLDASVSGSKRVFAAAAVMAALALGWYFHGRSLASTSASALTSSPTPEFSANAHSIAVLPFVNMSDDKDNQYFSDGISEEILNVLAGTPELLVAARTSSFSFRDGKKELPEIARELKVRMVLEGSVRKQGERVRITAQLIDASNGYHVWSQTYDRDLKDIFAIQDEIAKAITDELKVKLDGVAGPKASSRGTRNVQAHDLYLRGSDLWRKRREAGLWQALDLFQKAAALDPEFAEAYAGQANVYVILPDWSARISYGESLARALDSAERAGGLDATLPEPYIALGYLADGDRRRETAAALYRRAIALRPSYATAYQWFGNSLWSGGRLAQGVAMLERASALDPRSEIIANNHGMALIAAGRFADAKALCAPMLKSTPASHPCLESTGFAALQAGEFSEARTAFAGYAAVTNPGAKAEVSEVFDALQGHGDRHAIAVRLANFLPQSSNDPNSGNAFQPYVITTLLALLGEPKLALSNLQAWAETDRAGMSEWAVMQPALGQLHCDLEFVALVKRMKTIDPHHAELCRGKP
ncbi:MAG: hypothetical protein ABI588_06425, partial [Arenimonas sp.]